MDKESTNRLVYLAGKFDIYTKEEVTEKMATLKSEGYTVTPVMGRSHTNSRFALDEGVSPIAIVSHKSSKDKDDVAGEELVDAITGKVTGKKISISHEVFTNMLDADPSNNNMYLQWMLTIFYKMLRDGHIEEAGRFSEEDLPQATEYLALFDGNKRKQKFKRLCTGSYSLKGIKDPTDINQYNTLGQLFDAVDPFIEKNVTGLLRDMQRYVDAGEAEMPVSDRKYTIFVPLSLDAATLLDTIGASWCTAKPGNTMFKSYTQGDNNRRPDKTPSKLYIIIDNNLFEDKPAEVYQIHFESRQLMNKSNRSVSDFYDEVLRNSIALRNYFKEELELCAKMNIGEIDKNPYIRYLVDFGFAETYFEYLDPNVTTLDIKSLNIRKLPDLGKFRKITELVLRGIKLEEIHPSIGKLKGLELLAIPRNEITSLPKEIGQLKKLEFINMSGNKIVNIPDEIGELDKSRGGSLFGISVSENEIGSENYARLKELLPTAHFKHVDSK